MCVCVSISTCAKYFSVTDGSEWATLENLFPLWKKWIIIKRASSSDMSTRKWWDRCYHVVCKATACITRCWLETQPFLLQSSFPNVSRKAAEDNPSAWALELMWAMWEKLLVWVWSSPGQCGHLGKEQEDRRHLFSLSSHKLPTCLYLGCSNKIKNNLKKKTVSLVVEKANIVRLMLSQYYCLEGKLFSTSIHYMSILFG